MLASALSHIDILKSIIEEIYNSNQTEIIELKYKLNAIKDAEEALNNFGSSLPPDAIEKKNELEKELRNCDDPDF